MGTPATTDGPLSCFDFLHGSRHHQATRTLSQKPLSLPVFARGGKAGGRSLELPHWFSSDGDFSSTCFLICFELSALQGSPCAQLPINGRGFWARGDLVFLGPSRGCGEQKGRAWCVAPGARTSVPGALRLHECHKQPSSTELGAPQPVQPSFFNIFFFNIKAIQVLFTKLKSAVTLGVGVTLGRGRRQPFGFYPVYLVSSTSYNKHLFL